MCKNRWADYIGELLNNQVKGTMNDVVKQDN